MAFLMDKALPSISQACYSQLVKMFMTRTTWYILINSSHTYLLYQCPDIGMQNADEALQRHFGRSRSFS